MLRLGALRKKKTRAIQYAYLLAARDATVGAGNSYEQIVVHLPPGQSHRHVITPSTSARNASIVAASMRLDLMLALRVVLSRSRFITMWRTMAKLLAA